MANILITARSFGQTSEAACLLAANGHRLTFNPKDRPLTEDELIGLIGDQDGVIAGVDEYSRRVLDAAPRLKIIARYGVGHNNVDLAAARERGVVVTITPGANTIAVAELTFGLMLAIARKIPQYDNGVKNGRWGRLPTVELHGKTLGIVGLGAIGLEVAKRAVAFGMTVVAYDPAARPEVAARYGFSYAPFATVVAAADYLSLHLPALPSTVGLIGRDTLRLMKPSAFLINTARGELVVEEDLTAALRDGTIAGAALDAFAHEPLTGPLLAMDNAVLTPHSGAATREAAGRMGMMAAEEVLRCLGGEQPQNRVG